MLQCDALSVLRIPVSLVMKGSGRLVPEMHWEEVFYIKFLQENASSFLIVGAFSNAFFVTLEIASMWFLEAISGTTPPYFS